MRSSVKHCHALLVIAVLILPMCKGKEDTPAPAPAVIPARVSGYAQKGPYAEGATVTIAELKADLTPTGRTYTTTVSSNSGYFGFKDGGNEFALAEITVDGAYFNEVDARTSDAPLKLSVITERARLNVANINVVTHLEKERVKYLVSRGTAFTAAKLQAMREVMSAFNVAASTLPSETLDIAQLSDVNGSLLSISVMIQGRRSTAGVAALLTAISNDMKEDGVLNDNAIRTDIRDQAATLAVTTIRNNLYNKYTQLELKTFGVPNFENSLLEFAGQGPSRSSINDVTGRSYRTLRLGTQWWMIDNLKTNRYSSGVVIPNANSINGDDNTVYYFTRDRQTGDPGNTNDQFGYGYFYTRAALMNGQPASTASPSGVQGTCPLGWHVPSKAEFNILLDYIQSRGYARSLDVPNNAVGFDLVKGGWRGYDLISWGEAANDWALAATDGTVNTKMTFNAAYNVRCVKD